MELIKNIEKTKEIYRKIDKLEKDYKTEEEKIKNILDDFRTKDQKKQNKIKEEIKAIDEKQKNILENKEVLQTEIKIIKNNIYFIIKNIFENEKIINIFDKYKRIGEKTREKIENEIIEIYKKYNIEIYCYLSCRDYLNRYNIIISLKDYNIINKIEIECDIQKKESYFLYNSINNYIQIEEIEEQANKIYFDFKNLKIEIKKDFEKIKNNIKDFENSNSICGELYEDFTINTSKLYLI